MWNFDTEELTDGTLHLRAECGGKPAAFADVMRSWRTDAAFRAAFNAVLAAAPFSAFRWETPGVTAATLIRPFEFVLLDEPGLAQRPDPEAFAEHFRGAAAAEPVVVFPNLGGDALLVVPRPVVGDTAYGHLAAFVREAPGAQRDALWYAVGEALARRVGPKPVWLSTAGAGVSWLHVRLDDRPKYYGYEPYRTRPTQ
jgi:hypothetical protein